MIMVLLRRRVVIRRVTRVVGVVAVPAVNGPIGAVVAVARPIQIIHAAGEREKQGCRDEQSDLARRRREGSLHEEIIPRGAVHGNHAHECRPVSTRERAWRARMDQPNGLRAGL